MGYKFDNVANEYEFEAVANAGYDGYTGADTYMVNNINSQLKQFNIVDLVQNKMTSLAETDYTFDEIQADGNVKQISLKADEVVGYLNSNRTTFEEAGRNSQVTGEHILAFCIKNGMTADDLIHYTKYPDDDRSKELDKIVQQSKKEFIEIATCKNKEKGHQKAAEFYAQYTKSFAKEMDRIRQVPNKGGKDIEQLMVCTLGQNSTIGQTIKEVNRDIINQADKILADEKYPVSFQNIQNTVNLTSPLYQEYLNLELVNDPEKINVAGSAYAKFNLIADNFRKEFSEDKDIHSVLGTFDDDKATALFENPMGADIEIPDGACVNDDPTMYSYSMDIMLDKDPLARGPKAAEKKPEGKLSTLLKENEALESSSYSYKKMIEAANHLEDMIKAHANKEQQIIAYRELQLKSAECLASSKDITSQQKEMCEKFFQFAGSQKLSLQGKQLQAEREFEAIDASKLNKEDANRQLEQDFANKMAASQKKIWGKSSQEFTKLQNTLNEYNELLAKGDDLNADDYKKLYDYTQQIQKESKAYLDLKEGQDLTKNGKERYQIVKELNSHFKVREKDYFIPSLDARYQEFVKNPRPDSIETNSANFVGLGMDQALSESDNFACNEGLKYIGANDRINCARRLSAAKTREEFDAFLNKKNNGIDAKNINLIKDNADFIFACCQKDAKDKPERQTHAREILDNIKYPEPNRDEYEATAKANGIKIKDPSGDAHYLENIEKLRDVKKDLALQSYGKIPSGVPRWAKTLYNKPGLTDEERSIIIEGSKDPKNVGKLYDFVLQELCNMDVEEVFREKSMDEYVESFAKENYLRQLAFDSDTMFNSMDLDIKSGNYKIDQTLYNQTKKYVKSMVGNAGKTINSLDQYERPQSMVMDLPEDLEPCLKLAGSPSLSAVDKHFVGQQLIIIQKKDPLENILKARETLDITREFEKHSTQLWAKQQENFAKFKEAYENKSSEAVLYLQDMIDDGAELVYYNMAKLESDKFTKEMAEVYLDPKTKAEKIAEIRPAISTAMSSMSVDELEKVANQTEVLPENKEKFRSILSKNVKEKAAEKEAQKASKKEGPKKEEKAPQQASQGKTL